MKAPLRSTREENKMRHVLVHLSSRLGIQHERLAPCVQHKTPRLSLCGLLLVDRHDGAERIERNGCNKRADIRALVVREHVATQHEVSLLWQTLLAATLFVVVVVVCVCVCVSERESERAKAKARERERERERGACGPS